jgi:hypothetical protein
MLFGVTVTEWHFSEYKTVMQDFELSGPGVEVAQR